MKKLILAIFFFCSFHVFAHAKEVSSFIGIYTGYTQDSEGIYNYNDYEYDNFTYNYLVFGFSSRFGLSHTITDAITLYYLFLLEVGLHAAIGEANPYGRSFGEINYGAELKCIYTKYSFGLALGIINTTLLFARPSVGYKVFGDAVLELFLDYQLPVGFYDPFSGFKAGLSLSLFK
jgi:hypothetical protein